MSGRMNTYLALIDYAIATGQRRLAFSLIHDAGHDGCSLSAATLALVLHTRIHAAERMA